MAALLVGLSIMAVMLTVAMPVWRQTVRREKEAELVFRGEQYARAIGLFQRKSGPGSLPPSLDLLVEQRYLRKKYKDPITNDDFAPLLLSAATQPGSPTPGAGAAGRGGTAPASPSLPRGGFTGGQTGLAIGGATGGITGVTSKSKEQSIRVYKGRTHYNEWQFVFTPPAQAPGVGAPGSGPAGPGGQRGRGQPVNPQRGPFPVGIPGPGGRGAPTGPFNPGGPNGPPPTGPIFPPGQPPPRGR